MTIGGSDTSGFRVTPDSLIRIRAVLVHTAEAHLRARDAEGYPTDANTGGRRHWARAASTPLPSWHPDLDERFERHRSALLGAHEDASHHLGAVVRGYLASDIAVAAALDDTSVPTQRTVAASDEPRRDAPSAGRLDRLAPITDLDHAVTVWRRRRDLAVDTAHVLDTELDDLGWEGKAAEAFERWAQRHLRRWRDLSRAADTVHRALTDPARRGDAPAADGAGPDVPALASDPPAPSTAAPTPAHTSDHDDAAVDNGGLAPTITPPTVDAHPPGRPDDAAVTVPSVHTGDPVGGNDDTGRHDHPHHHQRTDDVSAHAPGDAASPRRHLDHAAYEGENGRITSALDPAPSTVDTPAAPDTPFVADIPAVADSTGHAHTAADPPAGNDEPPSAMTSMIPPAAAAGATAIARADRDLHVMREIPIPPSPTHPPGPPSPPATGHGAPASGDTRHLPAGTDRVLTAPDRFRTLGDRTPMPVAPGRIDPGGLTGQPSAYAMPELISPGPRGRPPRMRTRSTATTSSMWVDLHPFDPHGAWIDLTAGAGLGLTGPGARAIARTVLRELHAHTATVLIVPAAVLVDLTRDPTYPPTTSLIPAPRSEEADLDERVHIVDSPRAALRRFRDHVHGLSSTHGPVPVLLVVPAPVSAEGRDDLARVLASVRAAPAAVLVLGSRPDGDRLDLDVDHRVHAHHRPAYTDANHNDPGPGLDRTATALIGRDLLDGDLTGRRLHPTGPAELADELRRRAATRPPDTAAGERGPTESDERLTDETPLHAPGADDSETGACGSGPDVDGTHGADPAPPLTLCVLGPVELRFTPDTRRGVGDSKSGVPTVVPVPRLARELLAYLAAHPAGATRDRLVEVLCPDSTARRPETNLHAAVSRLRRNAADAIGDDSADDLVVTHSGRWMLDPRTVTVDYWTLLDTTAAHRDAPARRRRRLHAAVSAYRDLFAADLPAGWAHPVRESARRRHLEIINELAEIEIRAGESAVALELLERARVIEPLNEDIYRTIMSLQLRDGRTADAHRTYALLRTELTAIDVEPAPRTRLLLETTTTRV